MIPILDSNEFNKILLDAQSDIVNYKKQTDTIKNDITQKIKIMSYEADYINKQIVDIKNGSYIKNNKMNNLDYIINGEFDRYGNTITPKLDKEPINVFNLNTSTSGDMFFRNNVSVSINNDIDEYHKNILKHDSIDDKIISFYEFKNSIVNMEILLTEQNSYYSSKFNIVEFDPFLPGSFNIEKIDIYYKQDGEVILSPKAYSSINNAGKCRIVFDEKYDLYKIAIRFKINYSIEKNNIVIFPFGLKHLYFYDATFKKDSYIITTINRDRYISLIKNEILVNTVFSQYLSTLEDENIKVYSNYNNGALEDEIIPSTAINRNEIIKNINTLYLNIPLNNLSLIGISFDIEIKGNSFLEDSDIIYIDKDKDKINFSLTPEETNTIFKYDLKDDNKIEIDNQYSNLSNFGRYNNIYNHPINDSLFFYYDKLLNEDTINSNNIYIIKNNNSTPINILLENNKESRYIKISPLKALDYNSTYTLYIKNIKYIDEITLPLYKTQFYTEDLNTIYNKPQYYIESNDYKFKFILDFIPNEEFINNSYIFLIDENNNTIPIKYNINKNIIFISPTIQLNQNNYNLYIKKGISNDLNQILDSNIIQPMKIIHDNIEYIQDRYYVPCNNKIIIPIDYSISNISNIKNNLLLLNNNNIIDYNCDIISNRIELTPLEPLKEEEKYLIYFNNKISDTLINSYAFMLYTRKEEFIEEFKDNNYKYCKLSIPINYNFECDSFINKDSLIETSLYVLDEFYRKINYTISNDSKIKLDNLNYSSKYYIVYTNKILNINNAPITKNLKIYTLITVDNNKIDLNNKFFVPLFEAQKININNKISDEFLNNKYIYIIDEEYNMIPTTISQINTDIIINPMSPYKENTKYSLIVSKDVKNIQGISIKNTYLLDFITCYNDINIDLEVQKDLPYKYIFNINLEGPVEKQHLNSNYIYILDNNYKKLDDIYITYGYKDGIVVSNVLEIGTNKNYPSGNLKLIIDKNLPLGNGAILSKTKVILFNTII